MCNTYVAVTHAIRRYFYRCDNLKIPHMYYRCGTTSHVLYIKSVVQLKAKPGWLLMPCEEMKLVVLGWDSLLLQIYENQFI